MLLINLTKIIISSKLDIGIIPNKFVALKKKSVCEGMSVHVCMCVFNVAWNHGFSSDIPTLFLFR